MKSATSGLINSLFEKYNHEVKPQLQSEFGIKNPLAVPKLIKIVVNVGLGEAVANRKILDPVSKQLALITGQKPIVTHAHRAIATFKIAAGDPIGMKVTLHGRRMFDFMQKLIAVVLPRIRDFRGVDDKSFDHHGNYSLGFREQTVFPEIEFGEFDKIRGLEVSIVTTAKKKEEAKRLLELLGMPFKKH